MTYSALDSNDLDKLRARTGESQKTYLSIFEPVEIATAKVASAPSGTSFSELNVNTTLNWSQVRQGMSVYIGSTAGARDVGHFRVRKTPTASILYLSETSAGDPGRSSVNVSVRAPQSGDFITIVNDFSLWSVFSRIDFDGSTWSFLKDFDIAYTNQNEVAIPALPNIGYHLVGFADGTGFLQGSWSIDNIVFFDASIASVVWNVGSGTFVIGNSTSDNITVKFPVGYHNVIANITLSNGATIWASRHVMVHDDDNKPHPITISSDSLTVVGRQISFEALLPDSAKDFFAVNPLACIWTEYDDGSSFSSNDDSLSMFGFLDSMSTQVEPDNRTMQGVLQSASFYLQNMNSLSQIITSYSSPTNWQEAIPALMHIDFFIAYLFLYHTTFANIFNVIPSGKTLYKRNAWVTDPGSFWSQLQKNAEIVALDIGVNSHGDFVMFTKREMETSGERSSRIIRMTLNDSDIASASREITTIPQIGKLEGSAFTATTDIATPLLAQAPGKVSGQRVSTITVNAMVVIDVSELLERLTGAWVFNIRDVLSITCNLIGYYPVFEPCEGMIINIDLPAGTIDTGAYSATCKLVSCNHNYDIDNATANTTITLEPIPDLPASGGAVEIPVLINDQLPDSAIPRVSLDAFGNLIPNFDFGNYGFETTPYWGDLGDLSIPVNESGGGTPGEFVVAIAWSERYVMRTRDWTVDNPVWEILFDAQSEKPIRNLIQLANGNVLFTTRTKMRSISGLNSETHSVNLLYTMTGINEFGNSLRQLATNPNVIIARQNIGNVNLDFTVSDYDVDIVSGSWSPGTGFTGSQVEIFFEQDNVSIARPSFWDTAYCVVAATGTPTSDSFVRGFQFNPSGFRTPFQGVFTPGNVFANNYQYTSPTNDEYYKERDFLECGIRFTTSGGTVTLSEFNDPEGHVDNLLYFTNGGTVLSKTTPIMEIHANSREIFTGHDTDDFDLGIVIAGTHSGIFIADSYDGSNMTNVYIAQQGFLPTMIRIPFRTIDNSSLNNNPNDLQFYAAVGDTSNLPDNNRWAQYSYNSSTQILTLLNSSKFGITGTAPRFVGHQDPFSASGKSSNVVVASTLNGTTKEMRISDDGGLTSSVLIAGEFGNIRWNNDSDQIFWFAGTDGIYRSENQGATLENKLGNFEAVAGETPEGAFEIE